MIARPRFHLLVSISNSWVKYGATRPGRRFVETTNRPVASSRNAAEADTFRWSIIDRFRSSRLVNCTRPRRRRSRSTVRLLFLLLSSLLSMLCGPGRRVFPRHYFRRRCLKCLRIVTRFSFSFVSMTKRKKYPWIKKKPPVFRALAKSGNSTIQPKRNTRFEFRKNQNSSAPELDDMRVL